VPRYVPICHLGPDRPFGRWGARVDTASVTLRWGAAARRLPAVAAVLVLAACTTSSDFCSLVGCLSQLTVRLDLPASVTGRVDVEVCVDQSCEPTVRVASPDLPAVLGALRVVSRSHTTLTVRATQHGDVVGVGTADVTLHRLAPNGTRCGPVCYRGTVRLRPHTLSQVGTDADRSRASG
jgi:hypothetical protein